MFGKLDELHTRAQQRLETLKARGMEDAEIYDPTDTSVKGIHAFFLVRGSPKAYNLPPNPEVPTVYLKKGWQSAAIGSAVFAVGALFAFLAGGKQ
jgi:formate dehydrogenase iron-sulfur subunit